MISKEDLEKHGAELAKVRQDDIRLYREVFEYNRGYQAALDLLWPVVKNSNGIATSRDCGCRPCRGQCTSDAALIITLEAIIDNTCDALTSLEKALQDEK